MEVVTQTEPTMEPVVEAVSTEEVQTIEWKAPESKEALDNMLKAEANRTYTKALKDLGVSSVKEFKEAQIKLQEDLKSIESVRLEKEHAIKKATELQGEYNRLRTTSILNELNIEEDYREDLIKLASDKVNDETPIETVLKEMVEGKYKYTVANQSPIKIGTEKSQKISEDSTVSDGLKKKYPWLRD